MNLLCLSGVLLASPVWSILNVLLNLLSMSIAILFLSFSQFCTALDISLCFFFFLYLKILIGRRNLQIIFLPYCSVILSGFFLSLGNLHGFCLVWNGLVTHFFLSSFLLLWRYLDWTVILLFPFRTGWKVHLAFLFTSAHPSWSDPNSYRLLLCTVFPILEFFLLVRE